MSPRPHVRPRSAELTALAAVVADARLVGTATITGITIDSRDVQPGDLFAALRGSDFDGHAFIHRAIANGAAAVLVETLPDDLHHSAIVVGDSRRDLAPIATEFFGHPSRELQVIGLTGTDGKTTTSALVRFVLTEGGIQTGAIGTLGIEIGDGTQVSLGHQTTPESHIVQGFLRQMVEAGSTAAVLESTSHGLAMHRLDGTRFSIAAVTNITHEHLEFHKTIQAYRAAKGILVQRAADSGGTVILNADDEGAMSLASLAAGATLYTYSMSGRNADYLAEDVVASHNGCTFTLVAGDDRFHVDLPLIGEFNIANALCATAIAHSAGMDLSRIVLALSRIPAIPGRMHHLDEGQAFGVIVDYAHTPASLEKTLGILRRLVDDRRIIVVSGSAGERDATKRPLQGKVMSECADVVVITSEDPRNEDPAAILADIAAGADDSLAEIHQIIDRREAIALAFSRAEPGDIVLLAGKGHETSIIWGFEHRPWDEEAVARELLQEMNLTQP